MTARIETVTWVTGGRESSLPANGAVPDDDLLRATADGDPRTRRRSRGPVPFDPLIRRPAVDIDIEDGYLALSGAFTAVG